MRRPAVASSVTWGPASHRRGLHDGSVGLGIRDQAVNDPLQILHALNIHLGNEAILARDAVAFHNLRSVLDQLHDAGQLAHHGSDPDVSGTLKPSARGSRRTVYPIRTPTSSKRFRRSLTLWGERDTVRARSASESRALSSRSRPPGADEAAGQSRPGLRLRSVAFGTSLPPNP